METQRALPKTMFAWRKHNGSNTPVYEEILVPDAPADGLLIKVLAAGVCHSDQLLVTMTHHVPYYQDTFTLGHETCGRIVKVGEEVTDSRFKPGVDVAVFSVPGCGKEDCTQCSSGAHQLCMRFDRYGMGHDGGFADYIAVTARAAVPIPDGMDYGVGAVATDSVVTSYHAIVKRADTCPTDTVFIFGLGGLGFNAMQIVRHLGARVIVSDVRQQVLDEAINFGVPKEDVVPAGKSVQEFVKENGLEDKIDIVADFVGTQQTFTDAQYIVRIAGKIVCIGLLSPEIKVNTLLCVRKHLSVLYSFGGAVEDLSACLDLISQGVIQPQVSKGSLEDFPKVLQDLHEGKIKSRIALLPPQAG